jgi:hypothetical protein
VTQESSQPSLRPERGRPPGQQLDSSVHVRLPRAAVLALKYAASRLRVSTSVFIRQAIVAHLVPAVSEYVRIVRDSSQSVREHLEAIQALDLLRLAAVQLSPLGLQVARQNARRRAGERQRLRRQRESLLRSEWPECLRAAVRAARSNPAHPP